MAVFNQITKYENAKNLEVIEFFSGLRNLTDIFIWLAKLHSWFDKLKLYQTSDYTLETYEVMVHDPQKPLGGSGAYKKWHKRRQKRHNERSRVWLPKQSY